MPRVAVNPDQMRQFARKLESIQGALHTKRMTVSTALEHLHQHWRDEKYRKFEETFERTAAEIDNFQRRATEYILYLDRKARAADDYLGRR